MEDEIITTDTEQSTLVRTIGGEEWIRKAPGSNSIGLIKSFWVNFAKDLEAHINYEYNRDIDQLGACDPDEYIDDEYAENQCELNDEQAKLIVMIPTEDHVKFGTVRSLANAQVTTNSDRAAGSKHGAGLALDITINTAGPDASSMFQDSGLDPADFNYSTHNVVLAGNAKLVRVIRSFVNSVPSVIWGGDFDGGTGGNIVGRGIIEFHHFEITDSDMPGHFEPHAAELARLDSPANSLTSTSALSSLYAKITESEDKNYGLLREFIIETIR
jgi:hypothetical protein